MENIICRKPNERLEGKRIILKRVFPDIRLAQEIFEVEDSSRDDFLPWLGWIKETLSPNDTLEFLKASHSEWEKGINFVFGIFSNDKFIGTISALHSAPRHHRIEIGYWLGSNFAHLGYMNEAVLLLEKELFRIGYNRIVIHTDVLNLKSANVAKRAGYIHEGILRQEIFSQVAGRYRDLNIFSKLKKDIMNVPSEG